ncbi:MAG TPA: protein kinase [Candidatus Krumholzibacteria bacterium]|nr:protein kinase [Candidatus Krumholzibacteria bacterium]
MSGDPRPNAEDLFDHAADLPPAERAAYLDAAYAGDDALRREVDELLAADARAGGFLRGEADLSDLAAALDARSGPAPSPGDRVGAWRLLRELGAGGMGTVHLAEREEGGFTQRVAVKLVRAGMDNAEMLERFRRERQLLAGLEHPHIARLIDGGRTADGRPFLVMEHVDGAPIDRHCADRGLDVPARLRLFLDVCAAVAHAHRHLVVHRDLKPSNVLVTADGGVKLLDFGIAKVLDADAADATLTGRRVLSPRYASPEQVEGRPVTTAADVYSLGVILYELITGRSPYPDPGDSLVAMERHVREHRPSPPSTTSHARGRGAVAVRGMKADSDLDAIVLKTLRKEPERRYAGVDALADDLRRFLGGRPVLARPDFLGYRLGKFARRNRTAVLVTAAALMVTAAAGAAGLRQARRAEQEQRAAAEIGAFLEDMLASLDPEVAQGQDTALLRGLLDRAAATLDHGDVPSAAAARLHGVVGRTLVAIGEGEAALPHLRRAADLGTTPAERRAALSDLGWGLFDAGRYEEAADRLRESRAVPAATPADAVLDFRLGKTLEARGDMDEAESLLRLAADDGDPSHLRGLAAFLMYNRQAYAETDSLLTAALDACGAGATAGVLEPPTILLTRSTLRRYQGDQTAAEAAAREALAGFRAVLPPDHPTLANAKDQLASILEKQERWDEAEALFREAYLALRASLGPDHRDLGTTANNLAGCLRQSGKPDDAAPFYAEALRIYRASLGGDHSWVGIVLGSVAANELARGRPAAALEAADAALVLRRRDFGPDHWRTAMVESMRGEALGRLGRREEAEPELRRGHQALLTTLGPEHPITREAAARLDAFYDASPSASLR